MTVVLVAAAVLIAVALEVTSHSKRNSNRPKMSRESEFGVTLYFSAVYLCCFIAQAEIFRVFLRKQQNKTPNSVP